MSDSRVESLDDEELLIYYETTKKLLKGRLKDQNSLNGKLDVLEKKLLYIEEELKVRSLWEAE